MPRRQCKLMEQSHSPPAPAAGLSKRLTRECARKTLTGNHSAQLCASQTNSKCLCLRPARCQRCELVDLPARHVCYPMVTLCFLALPSIRLLMASAIHTPCERTNQALGSAELGWVRAGYSMERQRWAMGHTAQPCISCRPTSPVLSLRFLALSSALCFCSYSRLARLRTAWRCASMAAFSWPIS